MENPLFTDECPTGKLRVSYTRLLVEVDVTQKLCEEETVKDHEGNVRKKRVEYEWKPQYCERCQKVGHVCSNERKITVKTWKSNPKRTDEKDATSQTTPDEDKEDVKQVSSETDVLNIQGRDRWIEVKRKKEDGKKRKNASLGANLFCSNVFESLGVSNDPKDTPMGVT